MCYTLSDRHITKRYLPDKAIDVMDETGARIKLKRYMMPPELREIEKELKRLGKEKNLNVKLHDFEKGASIKNEEDRMRKLHDNLNNKWRENQQKETPLIPGLHLYSTRSSVKAFDDQSSFRTIFPDIPAITTTSYGAIKHSGYNILYYCIFL